jgi:hypothetical protein
MGSILSAIHDDIGDYEDLCRKYGEEVQTTPVANGQRLPDCYGAHAKALEERQRREYAERKKA